MKLSWYGKHFGEEPPLVGSERQVQQPCEASQGCQCGAGAIFFSHCNLKCVFCQNYQISQLGMGKLCTVNELVQIMLQLQELGCINIDLVSPTLWWKSIRVAILSARRQGLTLPIVWNSNGYESFSILKEMEGLIDIYLPDFKYSDDLLAYQYSGIKNYTETAFVALSEMWRQVGQLSVVNEIAKRGLIVRHLVLPHYIQNSLSVLDLIARMNTDIYISLMNQYEPMYKAQYFPEINRRVLREEFESVHEHLISLGFENGWVQEFCEDKKMIPDFSKKNPFNVSLKSHN